LRESVVDRRERRWARSAAADRAKIKTDTIGLLVARPTIRKTNPIWMKSPQIVKLDDSPVRPNLIRRANNYRVGEDKMAANPFTRGTCPGRARPIHRAGFKMGHAKLGGRQKGTPNAISPRARKAIAAAVAAAARRIARGTNLSRPHWRRVILKNPLITEAQEHQGKVTSAGTPRLRSREFKMKSFGKDLSAVAMRAIKTDQFVDRDLVQCLALLEVRDPGEFAKFLALTLPKQSYLAARPDAEAVEPREAVNPGVDRRPAIPEWWLGFDPTLNSWTPVPFALKPQDAYHEVCGSPLDPAPGWDWKFDRETKRYRAIALRPKTPIPEWTFPVDPKLGAISVPVDPRLTPVPVNPKLTADEAYHAEYGSPLRPAPGWKWVFNSRTQRLLPAISDEPNRFCERRLFRWHPDQGHYSLVRQDDDWEEYEDNLYEYDAERLVFKRIIVLYEYDAQKNQFVRVAKSIK